MSKILIIEDNEDIRAVLKVSLEEEGYDVVWSEDGKSGLAMAKEAKPDIILLDVLLPDLNGFEVCGLLKSDPACKSTPVIMLTSLSDKKSAVQGLSTGADDYVSKPFHFPELLARVKSHLRMKELYDTLKADEREKAALLDLSKTLSSTMDPVEILYSIVSKISGVMEVKRCSITYINPTKNVSYVMASHDSKNVRYLEIDLEKYPEIRKVMETGKPVIISDVANEPILSPVKDALKLMALKSIMAFPIISGDALIGALILRATRGNTPFSEREIRFCGLIANLAAHPLKNAYRFKTMKMEKEKGQEDLKIANRALNVFTKCNQLIVKAAEEQNLLQEVCQAMVDIGGYVMAWVGYTEQYELKSVRPMAQAGFDKGFLNSAKITVEGAGPTGKAIRTGKACIHRNILSNPDYAPWRGEAANYGYESSMALPLAIENRLHGALTIYSSQAEAFGGSEVELLSKLTENLSYAINTLKARREKKKAEMELRKNRDSLAKAQEVARLGNWEWDIASNEFIWSDEIYRIFGLAPQSLEPTHESFLASVHPDDRELVKDSIKDSLDHLKPYKMEHKVLRPDGTTRMVLEQAEVYLDEHNNPARMIGTVLDITDRKRVENEILSANRALRALSEGNRTLLHAENEEQLLDQMCSVIVSTGGYRFAWVGYAEHDERKSIKPVAYAGLEEGCLENIKNISWGDSGFGEGPAGVSIRTGEPYLVNNINFDPSFQAWKEEASKRGYTSILGLPLMEGNQTFGTICIYAKETDIFDRDEILLLRDLANNLAYGIIAYRTKAEREQVGEALRKSAIGFSAVTGQEFFNAVTNHLAETLGVDFAFIGEITGSKKDKISVTSLSAKGKNVTPFEYDLSGTPCEEVVGQAICSFPTGVQQEFPRDYLLVEMGIDSYVGAPLFNKSGNPLGIMVLMASTPIHNEEIAKATLQIYADRVSAELERKHVEEALRKSEERLRQSQKMEAVGSMAGGIAHDFNNILVPIIGLSESTRNITAPGSLEHENLGNILNSAHRAKDIVERILLFTRKDEGKKDTLGLDHIVTEALRLVRSTMPSTIAITRKTDTQDLSTILGNSSEIYQVILNLCTNARQAMPDGGEMEISVNSIPRGTFVEALKEKATRPLVSLKVRDTGKGMDEKTKSQLFDPFFTTKEVGRGTGLGLSIVYGIVQNHGGLISVDSAIGKGTTFHIFFPALEKTYESADEPDKKEDNLFGNESILFVDDEPAINRMISIGLREFGYKVTVLHSGLDALRLFREEPRRYDLMITDLTMPCITGDKLSIELLKIRPGFPIILCTGYCEKEFEDSILGLGIKKFLKKPYGIMDLARNIRETLESAHVSGKAPGAAPKEKNDLIKNQEKESTRVRIMEPHGPKTVITIIGDLPLSQKEKNRLLDIFASSQSNGTKVQVNCPAWVHRDLKNDGFDKFLELSVED